MKQRRPGRPPATKASQKPNKFNAQPTTLDGVLFDSGAEARRYSELRLLEHAGEITDLELQPVYELQPTLKIKKVVVTPTGRKRTRTRTVRPITYRADFRYTDAATGEVVVEDVKGVQTEVFRIKAKMMLAVHGIEVKLVKMERER